MFILGARPREVEMGTGKFHCPDCAEEQPYLYKRLGRYFTVYKLPVFQIEDLGDFVECQECKQTFTPEVLLYKPPSELKTMVVRVRTDLEAGLPYEQAVESLMSDGMARDTASSLVTLAGAGKAKSCPNCGAGFAELVMKCTRCGTLL